MKDGVLGDFITLKRGYDLPNGSRRDGDVPVISSSGPTGTHNEAKVDGPGVVTGRYGTLGEIFYCESAYWPLNTALYVTDFKGNHPKFVYYFLHTLGLGQKNAAGAVPGVNRNVLHKLPVRVPEPAVQERIADILSAYDDLIDNNKRRISLLEESIHLLYREWFVFLRYPGHERAAMVEGIPDGWTRNPAKEAVAFNPSTAIPKDVVRPFVPMASLATDSMVISAVEERVPGGGAKFKNGDTLLARITPCLENGKTGYVQFMETAEEAASGSTEFIVMRGVRVPPTWVYCLARSPEFRQKAINRMSGSDGRQRVDWEALAALDILVPTPRISAEFDEVARGVFRQIRQLSGYNEKLAAARDALLPRLMDGRIPV